MFIAGEELERKIGGYYSSQEGDFYFEDMFAKEDFSSGIEVMARLAVFIFNRGTELDVFELARLDERNFTLAMRTIKLRYKG